MTASSKAPSPEEVLKERSRYLRGTIREGLADRVTGAVSEGDAKLLKFHGTYQQDDRDLRIERMEQKLEPAYQFMVRLRLPGGVCQPWQWRALDEIAREYANGSLRVTTRQTFQLHGVLKRDLKPTIASINDALITTVAACGDVNRNVVCHNNPYLSRIHRDVYVHAKALSDAFLPRTGAYHEIWLDGEKVAEAGAVDEEPLYGKTYLPRKFKMGIAVPPYNDVDVFAQDLGFIAIEEDQELAGFDVSVGGGMGMSHNEPQTYPRLGDVVGFCASERMVQVAEAVLSIQRDHGDRTDRKHARLKYTIDDHGLEWFKRELQRRLGEPLDEARPFHFEHGADPLGWAQDPWGEWHLTLDVLSGRIRDLGERCLMTALREIARMHEGDFRLTTNQNVIIARIAEDAKPAIQAILSEHGVDTENERAPVWQRSMSCVALPTCGLAMAESERMLPAFLERIERLMEEKRLGNLPLMVRVTGCPNGCARPYLGEVGLVGRSLGRYDLYLGADSVGTRLNRLFRESLTEDEVISELEPIMERFAKERDGDESFGDFVVRAGYVIPVREAKEWHR